MDISMFYFLSFSLALFLFIFFFNYFFFHVFLYRTMLLRLVYTWCLQWKRTIFVLFSSLFFLLFSSIVRNVEKDVLYSLISSDIMFSLCNVAWQSANFHLFGFFCLSLFHLIVANPLNRISQYRHTEK